MGTLRATGYDNSHTRSNLKARAARLKSIRAARKVLCPSTSGALAELIACTDLIRKGYEVFRAISPACSCDLTILKNGKIQRVEVRTATKTSNGVLSYCHKSTDIGRYDVLALVCDGIVTYRPDLS